MGDGQLTPPPFGRGICVCEGLFSSLFSLTFEEVVSNAVNFPTSRDRSDQPYGFFFLYDGKAVKRMDLKSFMGNWRVGSLDREITKFRWSYFRAEFLQVLWHEQVIARLQVVSFPISSFEAGCIYCTF